MDLGLRDRVALVTGASHGLGKAIALGLAAEGAKVAVNYHRNPEKAEGVVREIRERHGVEAIAVLADVAAEADVVRMFAEAEERLGPLEVLVNNAAVAPACPTADTSLETWRRTLGVNATGTFLCCREMVRRLRAARRTGRIVNISSQAAFRGSQSGKTAYDASKGAIISFTISLARELAPHGIAVNCVAPGLMYTEMLRELIDANRERFESRIPLRRIGTAEEVASVHVNEAVRHSDPKINDHFLGKH